MSWMIENFHIFLVQIVVQRHQDTIKNLTKYCGKSVIDHISLNKQSAKHTNLSGPDAESEHCLVNSVVLVVFLNVRKQKLQSLIITSVSIYCQTDQPTEAKISDKPYRADAPHTGLVLEYINLL